MRRAQARNFHCFLQVMRKEKKVYKLERRGGGGGEKERSFSIFFPIDRASSLDISTISTRRKTSFRRIRVNRECSFSSRELAARPISTGIHL